MWDRQERFTVMVRALSGDLYRYAFWLCKDPEQAEDLVQETCMRAWRALDSLRDERAAKAWLMTTLRREWARGFERKRLERVDLEVDLLADPPGEAGAAEALALRRALARLPEAYREPLVLHVLGGYSCEEIGEQLGLSRGAVMTRLFRARQRLRAMLEDEQPASAAEGG